MAEKWDNAVCREIGAQQIDGRSTSYHLKPIISGVQFDIAHHGPGVGKKIHTFGNVARNFARNVFMLALTHRAPLPQVIMRAYVHKKDWQTLRDFGHAYHMIITPAWQWATEYKHKIDTEDDLADVGGAVITVENGRVLDAKSARSSGRTALPVPLAEPEVEGI